MLTIPGFDKPTRFRDTLRTYQRGRLFYLRDQLGRGLSYNSTFDVSRTVNVVIVFTRNIGTGGVEFLYVLRGRAGGLRFMATLWGGVLYDFRFAVWYTGTFFYLFFRGCTATFSWVYGFFVFWVCVRRCVICCFVGLGLDRCV